jgi:hypothetical protein
MFKLANLVRLTPKFVIWQLDMVKERLSFRGGKWFYLSFHQGFIPLPDDADDVINHLIETLCTHRLEKLCQPLIWSNILELECQKAITLWRPKQDYNFVSRSVSVKKLPSYLQLPIT